jgi:hypothetical protein
MAVEDGPDVEESHELVLLQDEVGGEVPFQDPIEDAV